MRANQDFQFPVLINNNPTAKRGNTHPDPVGAQFQIPQLAQPLQTFNLRYLILHEEQIRQLHEMRHVLDMLDLIKAEVENSHVATIVKALNSRNKVIIEIEFRQLFRNIRR